MRTVILALLLALGATPAMAETIAAADAAAHVGQTVTVEGTVSLIHQSAVGTVFLDIDGIYPANAFTAVILPADVAKFPEAFGLSGQKVDVTGTIQDYQGKPEIMLSTAGQLARAP